MRDHYDISKLKMRTKQTKRNTKVQIAIRLDSDVVAYFKKISEKNEIPYQTLINLYLKDCATNKKEFQTNWVST